MDFWEIHDQYYSKIRLFILAKVKEEWVADDLVQETFLRVQTNIDNLRDRSKLSAWIFRIARNVCYDHFRTSRIDEVYEDDIVKDIAVEESALSHNALEREEMGRCIQQKAALLPESLRMAIFLYDGMGLNHSEVANILNITIDAAKTRLHRARKKLKTILELECDFEQDERNILTCVPRGEAC